MMSIGADWDSEECVLAFVSEGRLRQARVRRHPEAVQRQEIVRPNERTLDKSLAMSSAISSKQLSRTYRSNPAIFIAAI